MKKIFLFIVLAFTLNCSGQVLINSYIIAPPVPNTFIGGLALDITSPAVLATRLNGISESDIRLFSIDGDNVQFNIQKPYQIADDAFDSAQTTPEQLTYYIDADGFATSIKFETFRFQAVFGRFYFPALATFTSSRSFRNILGSKHMRFEGLKNMTLSSDLQHFNTNGKIFKRLYLGNCLTFGNNTGNRNNFPNQTQGITVYFHASIETANAGNPIPDVGNVLAVGGTVVYVDNYTAPSKVTDLSPSNVLSNSVQLDFTPPASTNALDFYEVFIDDGTENPVQIYTVFDEISGTGGVLSGLTSATTYKITIIACDEYWNRSLESNEIEITTL